MNCDTISIILAGGVGSRLHPLTADRAKPAVPFGGKYRIIDFALSNCLHSGLRRILVLTQYKSHSLSKHLRDGWSIFNPSIGEHIAVVPPQMRTGNSWYEGTADAVYQNLYLLKRSGANTVLILSGDHIYRMDYSAMLDFHREQGGVATIACMPVSIDEAKSFGVVQVDESDQISRFVEKPSRPQTVSLDRTNALASMGIYAFSLDALCSALEQDAKREGSRRDFGKDILPRMIREASVFAYQFGGNRGRVTSDRYWRDVGTLDSYYAANMDLLSNPPPIDLYQKTWPIHSVSSLSPPARIDTSCEDNLETCCDNIMLGPGSTITGAKVVRSILSDNVQVHPGAVVENSILFADVTVGRGVQLRNCIVDKEVHIPKGTRIGFDGLTDSKRFVVSRGGITVVPRGFRFDASNLSASARKMKPSVEAWKSSSVSLADLG